MLCGVNQVPYAVTATIASVEDVFNFTVSGAASYADGWFNQGVLVLASGTVV